MTLQEIECIIFPGSGGTVATGAVGPMTTASCHAAVSWLSQYGAAELEDLVQLKNPRDYVYHFHYPPYDLPNDELHLGPTAYMALISAVTGWKANKKVGV
jgi:ATP-dependent Lon protease